MKRMRFSWLLVLAFATPALSEPRIETIPGDGAAPDILIFTADPALVIEVCGPADSAGCAKINPDACLLYLNMEVGDYEGLRRQAIQSCYDAHPGFPGKKVPVSPPVQ